MDGRYGVAFAQFDLGAVGLSFKVVNVNAYGDGLVAVFEVRTTMGLEEEVGVAGDLGRGAPDEAGSVLIDGWGEGDSHKVLTSISNVWPALSWTGRPSANWAPDFSSGWAEPSLTR